MATEWPSVSLGDVINLKRGYDLAARDRESGCVPIVSSSGPTGTHSKAMVDAPGVVTGRYGTIGLVHYVEEPFWPLNTTLYVQDFKGNDPRFVYYLLKTISYRDYLDKAAVPGINRNDVHRAMVCLPPIHEQESIAETMHCLDLGIESHRAENETIEGIARAIFKSWFVDFDPVRAKAEGREPEGMDAATAALFPSTFEDSERGPIPQGFIVSDIQSKCSIVMGQSPPGSTYNERQNGLPFFQGRADFTTMFPKRRIYCSEPSRFASAGDVLLSVRAPVGDINIALDDCAIGRGVASIRHKSGSTAYSWCLLKSLKASFDSYDTEGTVFGAISGKDLKSLKTVVPSVAIVDAFASLCDPIFSKLKLNELEARNLTDLRDTLLPRLISGKLRVPEAEAMLEAV
ncbi:MAG: restriction endonuclease subunit S [Terracidiphilus sp.]